MYCTFCAEAVPGTATPAAMASPARAPRTNLRGRVLSIAPLCFGVARLDDAARCDPTTYMDLCATGTTRTHAALLILFDRPPGGDGGHRTGVRPSSEGASASDLSRRAGEAKRTGFVGWVRGSEPNRI